MKIFLQQKTSQQDCNEEPELMKSGERGERGRQAGRTATEFVQLES